MRGGQILIDRTSLTPARILTGYVTVGVLLTALGLYEPLVKLAGCGATVPLCGFGYTLAKGVEQAVATDGFFWRVCRRGHGLCRRGGGRCVFWVVGGRC